MTSTSITKLGGVVVITQVIPQDETSIQLQSTDTAPQAPPPAPQAPPPAAKTPSPSPTKKNTMRSVFLVGEPQGLGVVQIVVGVLCILFSLTAVYSEMLMVHAPFCLAVIFVISGSMALAALRHTSVRMVCATLVWNLISVLVGLGGVAYTCWLLAAPPFSRQLCAASSIVLSSDEMRKCTRHMWSLDRVVYGSLGTLLVLLVLQVCVSVTVCVFSAKAIRRCDRYAPLTVEVDDDHPGK